MSFESTVQVSRNKFERRFCELGKTYSDDILSFEECSLHMNIRDVVEVDDKVENKSILLQVGDKKLSGVLLLKGLRKFGKLTHMMLDVWSSSADAVTEEKRIIHQNDLKRITKLFSSKTLRNKIHPVALCLKRHSTFCHGADQPAHPLATLAKCYFSGEVPGSLSQLKGICFSSTILYNHGEECFALIEASKAKEVTFELCDWESMNWAAFERFVLYLLQDRCCVETIVLANITSNQLKQFCTAMYCHVDCNEDRKTATAGIRSLRKLVLAHRGIDADDNPLDLKPMVQMFQGFGRFFPCIDELVLAGVHLTDQAAFKNLKSILYSRPWSCVRLSGIGFEGCRNDTELTSEEMEMKDQKLRHRLCNAARKGMGGDNGQTTRGIWLEEEVQILDKLPLTRRNYIGGSLFLLDGNMVFLNLKKYDIAAGSVAISDMIQEYAFYNKLCKEEIGSIDMHAIITDLMRTLLLSPVGFRGGAIHAEGLGGRKRSRDGTVICGKCAYDASETVRCRCKAGADTSDEDNSDEEEQADNDEFEN